VKNYGIYITDNFIRFARTALNLQNETTIREQEINIAFLKEAEIVTAIKKFLKENRFSSENLTLIIPRTQVSIRYLKVASLNDKEINQKVIDELSKQFPYKSEDLIIDYTLLQKTDNGNTHLMLVVIQKEIILRQLAIIKQAGLVPLDIEVGSISLFNQFCLQSRMPAGYLLINFDDSFMEIMYINTGKLIFSHVVSFTGVLEKEEFLRDLNVTAAVLKNENNQIDKIILSGGRVDLGEFSRSLQGALSYVVEIDDTLNVMKALTLKDKPDILRMDFVPQEVTFQKKKEKSRRSFFYFITLALLNLSLITNIVFLKVKAKEEYLYLLKLEVNKADAKTLALQKNMLKAQLLQNYFNSNRLTLVLLAELYRKAPEGLYFSSLNISHKKIPGTIVITGQGKDSQTVLKFNNALKEIDLINKADIDYITKQSSQQQEAVEFKITLVL
jgi:Tfp pilus assembly PilM family ATPase/Tfp pilus assembly protein PilN